MQAFIPSTVDGERKLGGRVDEEGTGMPISHGEGGKKEPGVRMEIDGDISETS